jgi:hypothetical protein
VYQGQEIGMINIPLSRPISEYKDIETINAWRESVIEPSVSKLIN